MGSGLSAVISHGLFHEGSQPWTNLFIRCGELWILDVAMTEGFEDLQGAGIEVSVDGLVPTTYPILYIRAVETTFHIGCNCQGDLVDLSQDGILLFRCAGVPAAGAFS